MYYPLELFIPFGITLCNYNLLLLIPFGVPLIMIDAAAEQNTNGAVTPASVRKAGLFAPHYMI